MRWFKWLLAALGIGLLALVAYAVATARRTENPVGFQVVRVGSASGPIAVALWYPTSASPRPTTFMGGSLLSVARDGPVTGDHLPLVLISHGNGGSALSHVDLAMDLASAGYVVAAPTHAGDNYADSSRQASPALFSERAGQMRATADYVLGTWSGAPRLDSARVGAFGMSAGGFTVLSLIGGVPDMALIPVHCRRSPEFVCTVLAQVHSPLVITDKDAGAFASDSRIRAAVVAAPGLGFTFANGGLAHVRVPVQVWSGDRDETVPFATNTRVVLDGLGPLAEAHQIPGASHLSFLAPCGLFRPPAFCSDAGGFDRTAMHRAMNAQIVRFFNEQLPAAPKSPSQP